MRARREFLSHSARVATLLAAAGVLPLAARAQASSWPAAAAVVSSKLRRSPAVGCNR